MFRLISLRLLESYFRHRWLNLLPALVLIAAGVLFLLTAKPVYLAKGVVYVQAESFLATLNSVRPENPSWWATPSQATANDLNELLKTDAFIRAVINNTDLEEKMDDGPEVVSEVIEETRKNIWANSLGDTQIQINANHENPTTAYQMINAVIEGYVQWKINAQRAEGEAAQIFFNNLTVAYDAELDAVHQNAIDYLQSHPEPERGERPIIEQIEIQRLQDEIEMIAARYASALDKEENAQLAMAQIESDTSQSYILIDAPTVPTKPDISKKKMAMTLAIFAAVGAMLSFIAVTGGALLDRTFRFPIDVQQGISLPVLALIPDMTPRTRRFFWQKRKREENAFSIAEPANNEIAAMSLNLEQPHLFSKDAEKHADLAR